MDGCEHCYQAEALAHKVQLELEQKERQIAELNGKFSKYKLQSKAKIAQLRQHLNEIAGKEGDNDAENPARVTRLLLKLDESDSQLQQIRNELESVRSESANKDTQISDHLIRIKSLEATLERRSEPSESVAPQSKSLEEDIQKVYAQLVYKDTRILELNNTILEKDRQILDLQELCREKTEVATAKSKAVHILQTQIETLAPREHCDAWTETRSLPSFVSVTDEESDVLSPGHAVVVFSPGTPPPADPSEDRSSFTTDTNPQADWPDREKASPDDERTEKKKRSKKRVTFDLRPQESEARMKEIEDKLLEAEMSCHELKDENEELRLAIADFESIVDECRRERHDWQLQTKLGAAQAEQLQQEVEEAKRDGRNQVLKAKAQAQARIKELEAELEAQTPGNSTQSEVEELRSKLNELTNDNSNLRMQLKTTRSNADGAKQYSEILETENRSLLEKVELGEERREELELELGRAQSTAEALLTQKQMVLEDIDQLKEALDASNQLIDTLEQDLELSHTQLNVLREELGELRAERGERAAELAQESTEKKLKGKAYETKLRLLERENEELTRSVANSRLKLKAFDAKLHVAEREKAEKSAALEDKTTESRDLRDRLRNLEETGNRWTSERQRQETELIQLRAKVDLLNSDLSKAKHTCNALADEKHEFESELKELWEKESDLKRQLAESEALCEQLREERLKFRNQCKELILSETLLTNKVDDLTQKTKELTDVKLKLSDRIAVLESGATAETKQLAEQLEKLKEHYGNIDAANKRLEERIGNYKLQISDLEDDKLTLQMQLDSHKLQIEQAELSAKEQMGRFDLSLDSWKNAYNDLQAENRSLKSKVDITTAELSTIQAKYQELENSLEATNDRLIETQATSELLSQKEEMLQNVTENLQKLQQKFDDTVAELDESDNLKKQLQCKVATLTTELDAAQTASSHELSAKDGMLDAVSDTLHKLQTNCDDTLAKLNESKELKEQLECKVDALTSELHAAQIDNNKNKALVGSAIHLLNDQFVQLQSDRSALKKIHSDIETNDIIEKLLELGKVCDHYAVKQSHVDELEFKLSAKEEELYNAETNLKAEGNKTFELESKIAIMNEQQDGFSLKEADFENMIKELEHRLQTVSAKGKEAEDACEQTMLQLTSAMQHSVQLEADKEEATNKIEELQCHLDSLQSQHTLSCTENNRLTQLVEQLNIELADKTHLMSCSTEKQLETEATIDTIRSDYEMQVNDLQMSRNTAVQEKESSLLELCETKKQLDQLRKNHEATLLDFRTFKENSSKDQEQTLQSTDAIDRENKELAEKLAQSSEQLKSLQEENKMFTNSSSQIQMEMEELKSMFESKQSELQTTSEEHDYILNQHQLTIESLQSKNEELESVCALKDSKITQLHIEMSTVQANLEKTTHESLLKTEADLEITDLRFHLSDAEEEIAVLKQQVTSNETELNRLSQDRQNLCHEIVELNKKIQEAEGHSEAQCIVVQGLNESIDNLIEENDQIKASQQELQSTADKWNGKVTSLEEENQLLRQCLNDVRTERAEYLQKTEELDTLTTAQEEVINSLRKDQEKAHNDLTMLNTEQESMATKEKENEVKYQELDSGYKELAQYYSQLQAAYAELYQQYKILTEKEKAETFCLTEMTIEDIDGFQAAIRQSEEDLLAVKSTLVAIEADHKILQNLDMQQKANICVLEEEIVRLKSSLAASKGSMAQTVSDAEAKANILKSEVDNLKVELRERSSETKNIKEHVAVLENQAFELLNENELLKEQHHQNETSQAALIETNKTLKREKEHMTDQLLSLIAEYRQFEKINSSLSDQLKRSRQSSLSVDTSDVEILTDETMETMQSVSECLKQASSELDTNKAKLEIKTSEIDELQNKTMELGGENFALEEQVLMLKSDLAASQATVAQSFSEAHLKIGKLSQEKVQLSNLLQEIKSANEQLQAKFSETSKECQGLLIEKSELEAQLTTLKTHFATVSHEKDCTTRQLEAIISEYRQFEEQNKQLKEEYRSVQLSYSSLESNLQVLQSALLVESDDRERPENTMLSEQLVQTLEDVRSKAASANQLQIEIDMKQQDLDTVIEERSILKGHVSQLESQVETLQDKICLLEGKDNESHQLLLSMKNELCTKVEELETNCDKVYAERKELIAKLHDFQQQLADSEAEKQSLRMQLTQKVEQLEFACDSVSKERENLQNSLSRVEMQLELCQNEKDAIQETLINCQNDLAEKDEEFVSKKSQALNDDRTSIEEIIEELTACQQQKTELESEMALLIATNAEICSSLQERDEKCLKHSSDQSLLEEELSVQIQNRTTVEQTLESVEHNLEHALDECKELKTNEACLKCQLETLHADLGNLRLTDQEQKENIDLLAGKLSSSNTDLESLKIQLIEGEKYSNDAQLECEQLKKKIEEFDSLLITKNEQLRVEKEQMLLMQEELSALSEENRLLQLQGNEISKTTDLVESLQAQLPDLQMANSQKDAMITGLQQELTQLITEKAHLEQKHDALINDNQQTVQQLSSELECTQEKLLNLIDHQHSTESEMKTQVQTLSEKLSSLKQAYEDLTTELSESRLLVQSLNTEHSEKDMMVESLSSELREKQVQIDKLHGEVTEQISNLALLNESVNSASAQISGQNQELMKLKEQLQKEVEGHESSITKNALLEQQLNTINSDLLAKNEQVQLISDENFHLKQNLIETQNSANTMIHQLENAHLVHEQHLTQSSAEQEKVMGSLDEINQRYKDLLSENETLKAEFERMNERIEELLKFEAECQQHKEHLGEYTRKLDGVQADLTDSQKENAGLSHQLTETQKDLEEVKQKQKQTVEENYYLNHQLNTIQEECHQSSREKETCIEQLATVAQEQKMSLSKCNFLSQQISDMTEELDSLRAKENEWEQALSRNRYLEDQLNHVQLEMQSLCSSREEQNKSLTTENESLKDELAARKTEVQSLEDIGEQQQLITANLTAALQKAETDLQEQMTTTTRENQVQLKQISELETEIELLRSAQEQENNRASEHSALIERNTAMEGQIDALQQQSHCHLEENQSLVLEMENVKAEMNRIHEQIHEKNEKLQTLTTENQALLSEVEELRINFKRAEGEAEHLLLVSQEKESLNQELEELKIQLESVQEKNNAELQQAIEKTQTLNLELQEAKTETERIQEKDGEEIQRVMNENQSLTEQLNETQQAVVMLQHQIHELHTELGTTKTEAAQLQQKVSEDKTEELQMQVVDLVQTRDEAMRQVGQFKEQLNQYERETASLLLRVAQNDVLMEQVRELEKEKGILNDEKRSCQLSAQQHQDGFTEVQAMLESVENECSNLKEQLRVVTDELTMVTSREAIKCTELQQNLEATSSHFQQIQLENTSLREQVQKERIAAQQMTEQVARSGQLWSNFDSEPDQTDSTPLVSSPVSVDFKNGVSSVDGCDQLPLPVSMSDQCQTLRQRVQSTHLWLRRWVRRRGLSRYQSLLARWLLIGYVALLHWVALRCWLV